MTHHIPLEDSSVRALQTMLRTIYSGVPKVRQLIPDGVYGKETQEVVSNFQREQVLPITGAVDHESWIAIVDAFRDAQVRKGPAEALYIVLQPEQVIRQGEENIHLYLIQGMLAALARFYEDAPPPAPATGFHDGQTANSVRWLQDRSGIPVNGDIDRHTWRHLTHLYRSTAGDGSGTYPARITQRRPATDEGIARNGQPATL